MRPPLPAWFRRLGSWEDGPRVFYAISMVFLGVVILALVLWWLVTREKTRDLVLFSGQEGGIYVELAEKIAETINKDPSSRIKITVAESDGSLQNLREVLDDRRGRVLAIMQNDVVPDTESLDGRANPVRCLLPLHFGVLHFLVPADSRIESVSGLRGKTIGEGPLRSGTRPIIDALLAHYEIGDQVERKPLRLEDIEAALGGGEVDAVIITMGLKSASFEKLVAKVPLRFVPVGKEVGDGSEIEGFRLTYPFVRGTLIPKFAYAPPRGVRPGVPPQSVPAISVRSILVANESLPTHIANRITRILLENRAALSRNLPGVAQLSERFDPGELQYPIHRGSHRYLHRHDPGFLREYSGVFGFVLSLTIAASGFLISMKRWMILRRKDRIDAFYIQLDELLNRLRNRELGLDDLRGIDEELWRMNRRAVQQLASEKLIANESFRIFQASLSEGRNEVARRLEKLAL